MSNKAKLIAAIGAAAAALVVPVVKFYEGEVRATYKDPVGIVTACVGHTGPELQMGQVFTREQCEDMLYSDLLKHAAALECVKTPMTDGQKAAFLSFAFNVGNRAFCGSTLARKANAGDMTGACAELSRWTYAGGKQLPGLVNRRAAERQLCERGLS
ncbi:MULTISPECIES: lysozyme [Delftia]|uniref:lysozyme n=1 Tax=Delftia TaxID=80865 RepID=UPI0012CFD2F9|nr:MULTISPECIES: lysozyme [Delftia]MPT05742.1 lysozyme [Delftia sp.]MPT55036.1 lysozyme [Delftia sp.]